MKSDDVPPSGVTRRPGGRTARVRRDILDAVMRHLTEYGLDGLTVAAVAASAGVATSTVYRRWPTPPSLVADALADFAAARNPLPDTGEIRSDLHQLARQIADLLNDPTIARLVGAAAALAADPDVTAARKTFWDGRFDQSRVIVERAVDRGELRADISARDVVETLVAPLYFRTLVGGDPIDDRLVQRCVDTVMTVHRRRPGSPA